MATVDLYASSTSETMNWIEIIGVGQLDTTQGTSGFTTNFEAEQANALLLGVTFTQDDLKITKVVGASGWPDLPEGQLATNDYARFGTFEGGMAGYVSRKADRLQLDGKIEYNPIDIVLRAQITVSYINNGVESTKVVSVEIVQVIVGSGYRTFIIPLTATDLDNLGAIQSIHIDSVNTKDDGLLYGNRTIEGTTVVCFAAGTLIETAHGMVAVEALNVGDLVHTKDSGFQPIIWIGRQELTEHDLMHNQKLRPVLIKAGAIGVNTPATDLVVSPQHRILVRSRIAQKMFGEYEVLIAAKQLLCIDGIDVVEDIQSIVYYHILFAKHEIIFANGAEAESLYTGKEAIKAISPESRDEILSIFPELRNETYQVVTARKLVPGKQARQLADRHKKNSKALCGSE